MLCSFLLLLLVLGVAPHNCYNLLKCTRRLTTTRAQFHKSFPQPHSSHITRYCSNNEVPGSTIEFQVPIESEEPENVSNGDYIDEEALIRRINEEVFADSGVELEGLINPSKVVNLERDIIKLNYKLSVSSDLNEIEDINKQLDKKRSVLFVEKKSVMRSWLKNLFILQSVLAGVISLGMVYDAFPGYSLPLAIRVLGFWMWWLFIIPSLRSVVTSSCLFTLY